MDVFECINERTCVREFEEKEVPKKLIDKILRAAIMAPSAGNMQDWEFIVVQKDDVRRKLAMAALGQSFIFQAPLVIVACGNKARIGSRYGTRGEELYTIQDVAAAIENILLAVHTLGLGACWVGAFDEEEVSKILELPQNVRPMALIPIGWPAEKPVKPSRMPLEEVVHYDRYKK